MSEDKELDIESMFAELELTDEISSVSCDVESVYQGYI